jgi:MSHA biogenesis protein MshL
MVIRKILIICLAFALFSCGTVADKRQQPITASPDMKKTLMKSKLLPPPPPVIKQTIKEQDALEDIFITVDAIRESLSSVLYMVAAESGLNLIISPDIDAEKPFTLTVNNMPAREVLDIVSENGGVFYEVTGNTLYIKSMMTKTFKIPYVRMSTTQNSEIGGDVFGSSDSNLKGDYSLKYEHKPERNDVLNQIMQGVHSILFPEVQAVTSTGEQGASAPAPAQGGGSSGDSNMNNGYYRGVTGYVFNYFTGILKVTANPNKMKRVASYIEDVVKELDKQVLIEAKLVEVVLNDSSAYGINWSGQLLPGDAAYANIGLGASVVDGGINLLGDLSPVGVIGNTGSLTDWFAFMASHGRIESIGNPRVRVMNGQSAMISSGQLIPYWEAEREEGEDDEPDTITYSRVTVLDGVVMGVTAHVKEDESITLNIVPVFSDVEQVKTLMNANGEIVASYPIVNLKEAGTVLNVTSGDTIVMGGLISNVETDREEKIPVLGDIPVLGNIFKGKSKVVEKRELVIFLKTTIIER